MVQLGIFIYGLLSSFVLSGASANQRLGRRNPPILEMTGYVLCGLSVALCISALSLIWLRQPLPL